MPSAPQHAPSSSSSSSAGGPTSAPARQVKGGAVDTVSSAADACAAGSAVAAGALGSSVRAAASAGVDNEAPRSNGLAVPPPRSNGMAASPPRSNGLAPSPPPTNARLGVSPTGVQHGAAHSDGSGSSYPPATPHLNERIAIRASPSAGRGVYAARALPVGTLLEISPVLVFPADEYARHGRFTQLDCYTFVWQRRGAAGSDMAIALGIGSLFNHAPHLPNVSYTLDHATHSIRYTLMRPVAAGEELCISYGVGRMWWQIDATADDAVSEPSEDELLRLSLDTDDEADDHAFKMQGISEDNGHACSASAEVPSPSVDATSAAPAAGVEPPCAEPAPAARASTASDGAAPSASTPTQSTHASSKLWRITTAIDPLHAPLETVPAWVIDVEPRKTTLFCDFLRRLQHHPHFAEQAPEATGHLRQFRRTSPRGACNRDGGSAGIQAFICTQRDVPERATLLAMLDELNARDFTIDNAEPMPELRDVPVDPAPCRARSAEWSALWPVSTRPNANPSGSSTPVGSAYAGLVDRQADAVAWNAENTEWARQAMLRCVDLARQAKARGELPIAAFVTTPIQPPPGTSVCPPAGSSRIEAEAHDTRISERNPMKHAVTNAIKCVARIRVERERDRTRSLLADDSPARTPSPTVSGVGADDATRRSTRSGRPRAASPTRPTVSNGQDYLLNSLALFTTHEPCMSCCMALVHSRVRSLYFLRPAPGAGGCCGALGRRCVGGEDGGPYVIQEQSGLNHRFDVWRWRGGLQHEGDEEEIDALLSITGLDP